jgi:adenine-specific DNA-methyltransferase
VLVWRPVQYLGNKQRALPAIRAAVDELTGGRPADVADAFSGSGVVTQALALGGHRVRSVDASPAACVLARAATGTGRSSGEPLAAALPRLLELTHEEYARRAAPWARHLAAEHAALAAGDAGSLVAAEGAFPQVWRESAACTPVSAVLTGWRAAAGGSARYPDGFLAAVFAGTYLSLRQCLVLEAFLFSAHATHAAGAVDDWALDAARALAMHAASAAAFSAGKHFAQPHMLAAGKDLTFHRRRLLADRAVDPERRILEGAPRLEAVARAVAVPAAVLCGPVEGAATAWAGARVVYADPPYTAQQYSRFYHVLDLIASGLPERLQPTRTGAATRGLYPVGRFLSDFCRVRRAPDALEVFVRAVRDAGAHLVLSYSASATGDTGNARVIPLATVTDIVAGAYGRGAVDCRSVDLTYRSFNRTSVAGAADRELLVVARAA